MNAVEVEAVTKSFPGHTAVDQLSLTIRAGAIFGLIGPNGSGKTTTMRMVIGIYYPDQGRIRVLGEPVHGPRSDRVGYLPEERGLYKNMRVGELLQFFADLKRVPHARREVDRWLQKLGLSEWVRRKVQALSKGMSQKVQFIAAVLGNPQLLILDEPFSGLDPVNAETLRRAILGLRDLGTTVIFSTHDMHVAEQMCDHICMIYQGRKVLDGTLAAIQDRYGHDTLRVAIADGLSALQSLPGVESVHDLGQLQELRLAPAADPQAVLATLLTRTRIRSFTIARPSLHEIFVRIAGPDAREMPDA